MVKPEEFTQIICGACGAKNLPGEMFCQNCGVQLAPVASSPPPLPTPIPPAGAGAPSAPAPSATTTQPSSIGFLGKLLVPPTQAEIPLPAGKNPLLIGRADPVREIFPDVDLGPFGGEQGGVSRLHARLNFQESQLFLEDLNSTNFTFLNEQKLLPGQLYPLQSGDEIRFGLMRVVLLLMKGEP